MNKFKELFTKRQTRKIVNEAITIKSSNEDVKEVARLIGKIYSIIKNDDDKGDLFYDAIENSVLDTSVTDAIDSSLGETEAKTRSNIISALTSAYQRQGTEPSAALSAIYSLLNRFLRKNK